MAREITDDEIIAALRWYTLVRDLRGAADRGVSADQIYEWLVDATDMETLATDGKLLEQIMIERGIAVQKIRARHDTMLDNQPDKIELTVKKYWNYRTRPKGFPEYTQKRLAKNLKVSVRWLRDFEKENGIARKRQTD